MAVFNLEAHLNSRKLNNQNNAVKTTEKTYMSFYALCHDIENHLIKIAEEDHTKNWTEIQAKAIVGDAKGKHTYLELINVYLTKNNKHNVLFPTWYSELNEAIFHEIIGLGGVAEWLEMNNSPTCKVIQPYIYFKVNGRLEKQKQMIDVERFNKMINTLIQSDMAKRKSDDNIELMILSGTIRVTILKNVNKHSSMGTVIFRKYTVQAATAKNEIKYDLNELADLGMFGHEAVPLLKAMVKTRFNVNFIGAPETGKTTLLSYYQANENPYLEGITIQNEAEFHARELLDAPIIEFIIDESNRKTTQAAILRSDLDYLVYGEARRGEELALLTFLITKGLRGNKATYHTQFQPENVPFLQAKQIQEDLGGELWMNMLTIADGYDFLIETMKDPEDSGKKRLRGIHELRVNAETLQIHTNSICLYDVRTKSWLYNDSISKQTKEMAYITDYVAFDEFQKILTDLAKKYPMPEHLKIRNSIYSKLIPKY